MIIKERDIIDSDGSYIFKYMNYLSEEVSYPETVIPIIHNKKHNYDLIQLESFLKFGKYNNISDGTLAISKLCEYHNLSMKNIGFVINEESLYENSEISDTYIQLCEYNFPIYINPISKHSIYYMKLNEALILDKDYYNIEECNNIINYCMYPIQEEYLEDTRKTISKKLASVKKSIMEKINKLKKANNSEERFFLSKQIDKLKASATFLKNKLVES